MRLLMFLTLATLLPAFALAEGTITVQGNGRAVTEPDIANLSLAVVLTEREAETAMADAAARMVRVLEALEKAGVPRVDIRTSRVALNPVRQRSDSLVRQGEPLIAGFQVRAGLTITLRDLDAVGPVLDLAIDAGATEIGGIRFSREDTRAALAEARRAAVRDARLRAETYAGAAGLSLGEVEMIQEDGGGGVVFSMEMGDTSRASAMPVIPGEVDITARVTIRYALEEE